MDKKSSLLGIGMALAIGAAAMLVIAPVTASAAAPQVKCQEKNSCKGKGSCRMQDANKCKGKNSCKNHMTMMTKKACADAKGTVVDDAKDPAKK